MPCRTAPLRTPGQGGPRGPGSPRPPRAGEDPGVRAGRPPPAFPARPPSAPGWASASPQICSSCRWAPAGSRSWGRGDGLSPGGDPGAREGTLAPPVPVDAALAQVLAPQAEVPDVGGRQALDEIFLHAPRRGHQHVHLARVEMGLSTSGTPWDNPQDMAGDLRGPYSNLRDTSGTGLSPQEPPGEQTGNAGDTDRAEDTDGAGTSGTAQGPSWEPTGTRGTAWGQRGTPGTAWGQRGTPGTAWGHSWGPQGHARAPGGCIAPCRDLEDRVGTLGRAPGTPQRPEGPPGAGGAPAPWAARPHAPCCAAPGSGCSPGRRS